jgi:hypothetical protein
MDYDIIVIGSGAGAVRIIVLPKLMEILRARNELGDRE